MARLAPSDPLLLAGESASWQGSPRESWRQWLTAPATSRSEIAGSSCMPLPWAETGETQQGEGARFQRVRLSVPAGESVVVSQLIQGAERVLARVIELDVGEGASFTGELLSLCLAHRDAWQVRLAKGARVNLSHSGNCAQALECHAVVSLDAGSEFSLRFHPALSHKGASASHSAEIALARGAQGARARQEAKALMLCEGSRAWLRPWLRIAHDEVQARHGISVGGPAPSALHYLRARGYSQQGALQALGAAHARSVLSAPELLAALDAWEAP